MVVLYNVTCKFKKNESKPRNELKYLFNKKWLNVILKLENQKLGSDNS